ncbi:MAG TPA: helix-turn-helix transcriptional regulator [Micromonosporaceae bacterium]
METVDEGVARNVARNVRELREQRRHTVRSLSAALDALGRRILPSGITKIEDDTRRVDVGDLVALAIALRVTPNRLLLPVGDPNEAVALTPEVMTDQREAWAWAQGRDPLLAGEKALGDRLNVVYEGERDEFRRNSLPASERIADEHTAVRAAQDVLDRLREMLTFQAKSAQQLRALRERRERGDELPLLLPASAADDLWPPHQENPAVALRRALARLVAEIDDLIGDGDSGSR